MMLGVFLSKEIGKKYGVDWEDVFSAMVICSTVSKDRTVYMEFDERHLMNAGILLDSMYDEIGIDNIRDIVQVISSDAEIQGIVFEMADDSDDLLVGNFDDGRIMA